MRIYGRQILQVGWTTLFTRRRSLPRIYSPSLWSFRSPLLGSGLRGERLEGRIGCSLFHHLSPLRIPAWWWQRQQPTMNLYRIRNTLSRKISLSPWFPEVETWQPMDRPRPSSKNFRSLP